MVASELVDQCSERWSEKKIKILVPDLVGSVFSGTTVVHPIFKKEVAVLSGEHVTTETGTGFVHTAPAGAVCTKPVPVSVVTCSPLKTATSFLNIG